MKADLPFPLSCISKRMLFQQPAPNTDQIPLGPRAIYRPSLKQAKQFSRASHGLTALQQPIHRSSSAHFGRAGFTLLEVMVALAIFATAAMALTNAAQQYTQATANAILRTKAQFVASNEIALMEMNQEWMTGTASKQIQQQGEMWQIDKAAKATISPNVQRIDVQVSLMNPQTAKVEAGIANLVFFNARVKNS